MFEMFSLPLSHSPRLFLHASQLARGGGGGDNLADMLKSPHVVRVAIYLPRATHPDPSPPPPPPRPPSFCLYPSSKSCTCQERCSCHLPLFPLPLSLILFAFPAVHKATLNMPKWGWKCTHSLLFTSSSHRNSLPSSNPLHRHFLALPSPHSILSSHPTPALLQSPVILSLSSAVSVASIHPPLRLPHIGHRARCHWMLQAGFGKQGGGLTPGEEAWAGRKPQETRVEGEGASCGKGGSVWVNAITVTEKWECIYWIFMQTVLPSSHRVFFERCTPTARPNKLKCPFIHATCRVPNEITSVDFSKSRIFNHSSVPFHNIFHRLCSLASFFVCMKLWLCCCLWMSTKVSLDNTTNMTFYTGNKMLISTITWGDMKASVSLIY